MFLLSSMVQKASSRPMARRKLREESELGVQAPVGFWDPLGFTAGGDAASFRRRRYVELKHGRVSMLVAWQAWQPGV